MKVCQYCGSTVGDEAVTCPHCSSASFKNKCPECGRMIDGTYCPDCAARRERESSAVEEARKLGEEVARANSGLAWKTVLTVFVPFVGGYFLIRKHVKTGFRLFAIIWCAFLAVSVAATEGGTAGGNVIGSLLCLAPIAVYLYQTRDELLASDNSKGRLVLIAFAALLVFVVVGGVLAAGGF